MDKVKMMDTVKSFIAQHLNCTEEDLQKDGVIFAPNDRQESPFFDRLNTQIHFSAARDFSAEDILDLFRSVDWLSGNYPERVKKALDNCETVYTAWDGKKLVGLVNAMDDGEMTAYVHYLCVNPKYQGRGIGKELIRRIKEKYSSYLYIILIAEKESLVPYYRSNGFELVDGRYVFVVEKK